MRSLVADQKVYAARLRVKCGQLEYLKTLARGVRDTALCLSYFVIISIIIIIITIIIIIIMNTDA